jgi:hypothetical protein
VGGGLSPQCCKSLRSNGELVARESPSSKDGNTEAEKAALTKAVGRQ